MKYLPFLKRKVILFLSGLLALSLLVGAMSVWTVKAANPPSSSTPIVNKSSSWRSEVTISHDVPAGSYRLLAVAVMIRADESVSSVTYGGELLIEAIAQNDSGLTAEQRVEIWYLVNPPLGTDDLNVHLVSSANPSAIVPVNFTGVDQTSPIGQTAGADGATNNATTLISTLYDDSLIFGAVSARGADTKDFTPGTNINELWDDETGSSGDITNDDGIWGGELEAPTKTTSYTFNAIFSPGSNWAIACIELKAAPAPSFTSIVAGKDAYKNGDTVTLTITLDDNNTACDLTADFSSIDDQYISGDESVVNWGTDTEDNNNDGHVDEPAEQGIYVITYDISTVNDRADNTSYSVPVTATDGVGNSTSSSITLTLDNTAPPSPTNLTATAVAGGNIQLSWTASSPEDDVAYYNVYRSTTSGGQNYSSYTYQVSVGTTTYTDTSTTDSTTYYYVVRAEDIAGNTDTNTNEKWATAGITTGPSFSSITADSSGYKDGDTIELTVTLANHNIGCTLTADFSNIDSQYVTGGESVVNWGTDGKDNDGDGHIDGPSEQGVYVISYLISLVNTKTDGSYSVLVTATDAATNSASSSISLTLDNTAPPAPTGLTVSAIVGGSIQLSWTRSSPETDVAQYNIYRATSSGGENYSSPTYTVSAGISSYTDTSTSNGQTYYYVVRAQDAAGNIETNTNEVWATVSLAGPSVNVSDAYLKYEEELLYDLASSTDSGAPTVFAKGKIDKIYLRLNLVGGFELNKSSSSIILFRGIDEDAEEVLGSEEIKEGAGWAEFIFYIDPLFDPDADEHSRDALYWVDVSVVSTTDTINDFDFYFVYDTTCPAVPDFGITSFDPSSGRVNVSGTTLPDSSDPQQVEIFLNGGSQGVVTADGADNFNMDNLILASGDNYIAVQSTDRAGNKSDLSASLDQRYNPQSLLSIVIRSSHVVKSGSAIVPVEIIYAVTEPAQASIHIYNLLGETVKEWSEWVNPGLEPEWSWLGDNMYGETVNNGVYIVKVIADNGSGRKENVTKLLGVLR